jgi:hypothetical protein
MPVTLHAADRRANGRAGEEETVTEADWLACTDPQKMLDFLRGRASERKLRLFAVACVRRQWHLLGRAGRRVVGQAEANVDGSAPRPDVAVCGTGPDPRQTAEKHARYTAVEDPAAAAWGAAGEAADAVAEGIIQASGAGRQGVVPDAVLVAANAAGVTEEGRQSDLLRDLFRLLPFRPATLDPAVLSWHDATVVRLAQSVYEERDMPSGHLDNGRLAVLADALEEAGCQDPDILGHCRSGGEHVRGCWVVDLLLGKE